MNSSPETDALLAAMDIKFTQAASAYGDRAGLQLHMAPESAEAYLAYLQDAGGRPGGPIYNACGIPVSIHTLHYCSEPVVVDATVPRGEVMVTRR